MTPKNRALLYCVAEEGEGAGYSRAKRRQQNESGLRHTADCVTAKSRFRRTAHALPDLKGQGGVMAAAGSAPPLVCSVSSCACLIV